MRAQVFGLLSVTVMCPIMRGFTAAGAEAATGSGSRPLTSWQRDQRRGHGEAGDVGPEGRDHEQERPDDGHAALPHRHRIVMK